jgi:hypothetical protein
MVISSDPPITARPQVPALFNSACYDPKQALLFGFAYDAANPTYCDTTLDMTLPHPV